MQKQKTENNKQKQTTKLQKIEKVGNFPTSS